MEELFNSWNCFFEIQCWFGEIFLSELFYKSYFKVLLPLLKFCICFLIEWYLKKKIVQTINFCWFCWSTGEGSTAQNSSARKNSSTPKSRLLDTVRADDKNILICSKIKKVCRTCRVEQMQVLDQNEQLLELHLLDKRLKKYQLLDNIFSKENGVHVRQIG